MSGEIRCLECFFDAAKWSKLVTIEVAKSQVSRLNLITGDIKFYILKL